VRKIQIITIGKVKERWLDEAIDHYVRRMRPTLDIDFQIVRSIEPPFPGVAIGLDERGRSVDSFGFHREIFTALERGGSRLSLIIGGPDGLPEEVRRSLPLLSFSKMTFTHQTARLLLLEQLYRACEIEKGSKYVR